MVLVLDFFFVVVVFWVFFSLFCFVHPDIYHKTKHVPCHSEISEHICTMNPHNNNIVCSQKCCH